MNNRWEKVNRFLRDIIYRCYMYDLHVHVQMYKPLIMPSPNFGLRGILIASAFHPIHLSYPSIPSIWPNLLWARTQKLYMTTVSYFQSIWNLCTVRLCNILTFSIEIMTFTLKCLFGSQCSET